jgi:hypothetical protein
VEQGKTAKDGGQGPRRGQGPGAGGKRGAGSGLSVLAGRRAVGKTVEEILFLMAEVARAQFRKPRLGGARMWR